MTSRIRGNAEGTHLLPGPLIGEGDEDVAGRLEGTDDVILGPGRVEISGDLTSLKHRAS